MSKWIIYIADDQTLFRKGMSALVKSFAQVEEVREAANGKEMVELVKNKPPHAILMDLEMPEMDGAEATERIMAKYPDVKIIILSTHDDYKKIFYLMEVGAHAFLPKNAEPDEVLEAIESVINKDFFQNQLVVDALRKGAIESRKQKIGKPLFQLSVNLSDREKEVLLLICNELTNKEIGEKLIIS